VRQQDTGPDAASEAEALCLRAFAADREAERELCRRLAPAIRAFARRRLHGRAAVEDFAHDVLLTFVEALRAGRIEDPRRAAAFALGICRNLARERARTGDRRRELMERFGEPGMEPTAPPWDPVLLDPARLEDCLSMLTSRARTVIRRTFHDERTDEQIAAELAIAATNVRVIRHRSIAALRECLEKPVSSWEQR